MLCPFGFFPMPQSFLSGNSSAFILLLFWIHCPSASRARRFHSSISAMRFIEGEMTGSESLASNFLMRALNGIHKNGIQLPHIPDTLGQCIDRLLTDLPQSLANHNVFNCNHLHVQIPSLPVRHFKTPRTASCLTLGPVFGCPSPVFSLIGALVWSPCPTVFRTISHCSSAFPRSNRSRLTRYWVEPTQKRRVTH